MAAGIDAEHAAPRCDAFGKHRYICFVGHLALADYGDARVHLERTLGTARQAEHRMSEVTTWKSSGAATQPERRLRLSRALTVRDLIPPPSGTKHEGEEKCFVPVNAN